MDCKYIHVNVNENLLNSVVEKLGLPLSDEGREAVLTFFLHGMEDVLDEPVETISYVMTAFLLGFNEHDNIMRDRNQLFAEFVASNKKLN